MSDWGNEKDAWDEEDSRFDDPAYLSANEAYASKYYERIDDEPIALCRIPFPQYLQTWHWDIVRRRALLRAGQQCQRCEATTRRLNAYHLTYDRLGREAEADIIVLCPMCRAIENLDAPE